MQCSLSIATMPCVMAKENDNFSGSTEQRQVGWWIIANATVIGPEFGQHQHHGFLLPQLIYFIEAANSTDFVAHSMVFLLPINFVQSCAQSPFWIDHTWPCMGKIYKEQK